MDNKGITVDEKTICGFSVLTVDVLTPEAAAKLERVIGRYMTIDVGIPMYQLLSLRAIGECLSKCLEAVLEPYFGKRLCICGLGNPAVPSDALGAAVTQKLPLRVLSDVPAEGRRFADVCSVTPGIALHSNLDTVRVAAAVVREAQAGPCAAHRRHCRHGAGTALPVLPAFHRRRRPAVQWRPAGLVKRGCAGGLRGLPRRHFRGGWRTAAHRHPRCGGHCGGGQRYCLRDFTGRLADVAPGRSDATSCCRRGFIWRRSWTWSMKTA